MSKDDDEVGMSDDGLLFHQDTGPEPQTVSVETLKEALAVGLLFAMKREYEADNPGKALASLLHVICRSIGEIDESVDSRAIMLSVVQLMAKEEAGKSSSPLRKARFSRWQRKFEQLEKDNQFRA